MSKEDIGILLTGAGVVVCLVLWLIDKAGKNTMAITLIFLLLIGGLCLWGLLLFPWIWKADSTAARVWQVAAVCALVVLAVSRFGIWVWPHAKLDASISVAANPPSRVTLGPEQKQPPTAAPITVPPPKRIHTTNPKLEAHQPADNKPPSTPGAISQSNSGGLNVQQATTGQNSPIINSPINIGTLNRRISPQDIATIKTYLSVAKAKDTISVSADQNSNLQGFADDLYDAFKAAGWPMQEQGVAHFLGFGPPGKRFAGAVVITKGEPLKDGEQIFVGPDSALFYVGQVLEGLKIPRTLRRMPDQKENAITIQLEGVLE